MTWTAKPDFSKNHLNNHSIKAALRSVRVFYSFGHTMILSSPCGFKTDSYFLQAIHEKETNRGLIMWYLVFSKRRSDKVIRLSKSDANTVFTGFFPHVKMSLRQSHVSICIMREKEIWKKTGYKAWRKNMLKRVASEEKKSHLTNHFWSYAPVFICHS